MRGSTYSVLLRNRLRVNTKNFAVLFLMFTLSFSVVSFNAVYAGVTFNAEDNLSNNAKDSITPKLFADGNNVYVVWQEDNEINFTRSTDGGTSFDAVTELGDTGGQASSSPQFSISGNNIPVVWRDGNDISIRTSNDAGVSFLAEQDLSSTAGTISFNPYVAASGTDVYVVWMEFTDVFFINSTDSGATFADPPLDLNAATAFFAETPKVAASGTGDVYVVWADGNDISFSRSTDNGDTFPANPTDIGDTSGTFSSKPEIAASGNNVFIIWQQAGNISFIKSSDNGASFGGVVTLGSSGGSTSPAHKIFVSGNNIYVVWTDGDDVYLAKSTDAGDSFDAAINVSNSATSSFRPDVVGDGANVHVVWREGTSGTADTDIHYKISEDNGDSFGSTVVLSSDQHADNPRVRIGAGNIYTVWSDEDSNSNNIDGIKFRTGTITPTTVDFVDNASDQYRLTPSFTDTATIRVTDNAFSNSVTVAVTSTSGGSISVDLAETGPNTGIFEGTITFTEGADDDANDVLSAGQGDTITASFNGVNAAASIYPRTIAWDSNPYDRGDIAFLTVTDQSSNQNAGVAETIAVTITSQEASDAITLTLTETGTDTGVFGGNANMQLIFTEGDDEIPTSGTITVTVEITTGNDPAIKDEKNLSVTSTTDGAGINLKVTETGVATQIFTGKLTLSTGASSDVTDTIQVTAGDFLQVTSGTFTTNALIIPNNNPAKGLLQVKITTTTSESITAEFLGESANAVVDFTAGEPGGGGGGLVRPGLVLDILAGASIFTGGGGSRAPPTITSSSINAFGIASEGLGGTLEKKSFDSFTNGIIESDESDENSKTSKDNDKPIAFKKNEQVVLDFEISESIDDLKHVTLYMNQGELKGYLEKYPFIRWSTDSGLIVNDEQGIFNEADIEIIENDVFDITLRFTMKFGSELDESDVMLQIWNTKKQEAKILYEDAFVVKDSNENEKSNVPSEIISDVPTQQNHITQPSEEKIEPTQFKDKSIPGWVKTSAMWWSEDQINDKDFVMGIEYLVKNDIIEISATKVKSADEKNIPDWIKSMAGWWSEGGITDDEFKQAVGWLIERGVMKV